jgi:hypothetical protein
MVGTVRERKADKRQAERITYHGVVGYVHGVSWLRQVRGCVAAVWWLDTAATRPVSGAGSCRITICNKRRTPIRSIICGPIVDRNV